MPIMRTVTKVRPSTDVEFKNMSEGEQDIRKKHIKSNYFDTKKQIYYNKTLSEDGLTLTVERMFIDQDALDEFEADSEFPKSTIAAFDKENKIVVTKEISTVE